MPRKGPRPPGRPPPTPVMTGANADSVNPAGAYQPDTGYNPNYASQAVFSGTVDQTRDFHAGAKGSKEWRGDDGWRGDVQRHNLRREFTPEQDRTVRAYTPSRPSGEGTVNNAFQDPGTSYDPYARRPSPAFRPSPGRSSPRGGQPSSSPAPRRSKKDDFVPHLPRPEYIELSSEVPEMSVEPTPKLLVLDLNGALLYRTANSKNRISYPRPFLHNFLAYLLTAEPDGSPSSYEVLVWSSAQPHNVRVMVETTFGKWSKGVWGEKPVLPPNEKRVLDVWARDKMDLGTDYHNNVQTKKDLRDVINMLGRYDERSVLLLDDSPNKATEQPWSQIVVPEYDKKEFSDSKIAAARADGRNGDPTAESGMDTSLLAAIGILEALSHQVNIPAWIRSGGIERPEDLVDTALEVTLEGLPSASSYAHWHKNSATHTYWVAAGKEALARKGIPLEHGINHSDISTDKKSTSPFDSILAIARAPNTNDYQRDVLYHALDVLTELGHGPSGEPSDESEAHSQTLDADDPPAPTKPKKLGKKAKRRLRDAERAKGVVNPEMDELDEMIDNLKKGEPGEWPMLKLDLPPNLKEWATMSKKEQDTEFHRVTPPIPYRPHKKVLDWMKNLTPRQYNVHQNEILRLQDRLAKHPAGPGANDAITAGREKHLDELWYRLSLIIVPPGHRRYQGMVHKYLNLPQGPGGTEARGIFPVQRQKQQKQKNTGTTRNERKHNMAKRMAQFEEIALSEQRIKERDERNLKRKASEQLEGERAGGPVQAEGTEGTETSAEVPETDALMADAE